MRFAGQTLSELGIGPLRIGMTAAEADSALGGGFADSDIGNPPICSEAVLTGAPPGFGVELENGKVAAIAVEGGSIATSAGVHIGDPEAKIRTSYPGSRLDVAGDPDTDTGRVITVTPGADTASRYRVIFETDGKVVTSFRAGVLPVVASSEGCA